MSTTSPAVSPVASPVPHTEPDRDCSLCPRLVGHRETCRAEFPNWHNAPVPVWGDPDARIVIIGLAPGKHGANRTGRAFTGDGAGGLLFDTLAKFGLSEGVFDNRVDDGVNLRGVAIVNAVRCLPPLNKPMPEEVRACRPFLEGAIEALPKARVFVALGQVAHQSAVKALGGRLPKCRFAHAARHVMPDGRVLIDSYHTSRYNQNTGRLTREMFEAVFERAVRLAD